MFVSWLSVLTQNISNAIISFFKREGKDGKSLTNYVSKVEDLITHKISPYLLHVICSSVGVVRVTCFIGMPTFLFRIRKAERTKYIYENYESDIKRI